MLIFSGCAIRRGCGERLGRMVAWQGCPLRQNCGAQGSGSPRTRSLFVGTADAWLWLWRWRGRMQRGGLASGRSISHRSFWWRVGMNLNSGLWGRSHRTANRYCNIVATRWWWDCPEPFLTGTDLLLHRMIRVRGWLWGSSDISRRLLCCGDGTSHGRFHTPKKPRRDSLGNGLGNGSLQVAFWRHGRW